MRHLSIKQRLVFHTRQVTMSGLSLLLILAQPTAALAADPATLASDPAINQTPTTEQTAETEASINTTTTLDSTSGDSQVNMNTTAGNAATGDALGSATVVNTVNTSLTADPAKSVETFIKNVAAGDNTDIVINPGQLPGTTGQLSDDEQVINNQADLSIDNTVDVNAASGNARVTNNTTAGNATTGDANAVANVINSLSSTISSGQSFIGVINVLGDYKGDILLPESMLKNLYLAAATVNDIDNQSVVGITNNVTADAVSGDATVRQNTTAGKATTGQATTQTAILNVVSQTVQADRALLVFINVLGKWTGLMWQPDVSAVAKTNADGSAYSFDNQLNAHITNDISTTARSGDALVATNTTAGNATSGDATAQVNLLNMVDASFAVSDWFGILFINILGDWNGNLGINSPEPNKAKPTKPVVKRPIKPGAVHKPAAKSDFVQLTTSRWLGTIWPTDLSLPSSTDQGDQESEAAPRAEALTQSTVSYPESQTVSATTDSPVETVNPLLATSDGPSGAETSLVNVAGMLSLVAAAGGLRLLRGSDGQ